MPSTMYELQLANLFCGDDDPNKSQYLVMEEIKLPKFEEVTHDHAGGGAIGKIQIGMTILEPLEMTFKLRGMNPDVQSKFGLWSPNRHKYTVRGWVKELLEGKGVEVLAVAEGRLQKVEADAFKVGDGIAHDYCIREILKYRLYFDNKEKYWFDYGGGPSGWRVDGVAPYREAALALGLPS